MKPDIWHEIITYTKRFDPDPQHAFQVCKLSLSLFDCLKDLHQLGADARDLLRAGSLLHDIGWSFPGKPHHKASRDRILSERLIPFKSKERKIVALIARYHRKSYPDENHSIYRDLDSSDKQIVLYCGGILRIADVLDRSHMSRVSLLQCKITPESILIFCTCTSPLSLESAIFSRKSGLLEKLTGHLVLLICI